MKAIIVVIISTFILLVYTSNVFGGGGILLDCEIEGGYGDNQIYINIDEGYVLYHAQLHKTYERMREYCVSEPPDQSCRDLPRERRKTTVVDEGLDITQNNDQFIIANDENSTFAFVKESGRFAYAFTTLIPLKEGFGVVGNHHMGQCSSNPFTQPNTD